MQGPRLGPWRRPTRADSNTRRFEHAPIRGFAGSNACRFAAAANMRRWAAAPVRIRVLLRSQSYIGAAKRNLAVTQVTHARMRTRAPAWARARTHARARTRTQSCASRAARAHAHIHTHAHTRTHIHTRTSIHTVTRSCPVPREPVYQGKHSHTLGNRFTRNLFTRNRFTRNPSPRW